MQIKHKQILQLTLDEHEMELLDRFLFLFEINKGIEAANYYDERELREMDVFCNKLRPLLNNDEV